METLLERKINVITAIIGAIVTVVVSIGGSFVTTQVTIAVNSNDIQMLKAHAAKTDKKLELLYDIKADIAVIKERTNPKKDK
jgi:hypothetical protein